ncbi:MAG TPA: hypothetical protein VM571_07905 [Noviherbaspirillum sp.]|nr:hypothetical protein [Noviherbaspirillum sp.]
MPDKTTSFWSKLAAITAFLGALAAVGALVDNYLERGTDTSVSGTYNGQIINKTFGQGGKLRLILNDASGKITGTVIITGALGGSGPLEGQREGNRIGFTSLEQSTGMLIAWEGVIEGSTISGDYSVSLPMASKVLNPTFPDQVGEWEVGK